MPWDKNWPKTDKNNRILARNCFTPELGCRLYEFDQSNILRRLAGFVSIPSSLPSASVTARPPLHITGHLESEHSADRFLCLAVKP
jgi:hypothetical protein